MKLKSEKLENIFKNIDNDKNIIFDTNNEKYLKYIDDIKRYLEANDIQSLTNKECPKILSAFL